MKAFSYSELRKATHDFSGANKVGEGGFGSVFRVISLSQWPHKQNPLHQALLANIHFI